jgi:hypothetical protein
MEWNILKIVWIDHRSYFHNIAINPIAKHSNQKGLDFELMCLNVWLHTNDIFLEYDLNIKACENSTSTLKPQHNFTFLIIFSKLNSLKYTFTHNEKSLQNFILAPW